MITWAKINYIYFVLPLILMSLGMLYYKFYRTKKVVKQLSGHKWTQQFLHNFSYPRLCVKISMLLIGIIFLLISLLHPQWSTKEETVKQRGRDLFIALDVSRSMLAKDCIPNRLECAKAKIKSLVHKLSSDRVGLIIFSGTAVIQCPLTADYSAFYMFLDQVDVETIASGTTALDQVILKVLDAYRHVESQKTKLLAIFTDGEDFSTQLSQVKKQARDQQLHIFTSGVGTKQGAPIPLINQEGKSMGHIKDKQGSVVISRLNEDVLYNVAQDSGGTYVPLTENNDDITSMVSNVKKFEKQEFGDKKFAKLEEQYPYFLFISFICFLIEWLL